MKSDFLRPPSQKSQVKKFMVLFCQVSQLVSSLIDNFIGRVVRTQGFFSQKERNFPFSRIDFFMATWSGEGRGERKKKRKYSQPTFFFFFFKVLFFCDFSGCAFVISRDENWGGKNVFMRNNIHSIKSGARIRMICLTDVTTLKSDIEIQFQGMEEGEEMREDDACIEGER